MKQNSTVLIGAIVMLVTIAIIWLMQPKETAPVSPTASPLNGLTAPRPAGAPGAAPAPTPTGSIAPAPAQGEIEKAAEALQNAAQGSPMGVPEPVGTPVTGTVPMPATGVAPAEPVPPAPGTAPAPAAAPQPAAPATTPPQP